MNPKNDPAPVLTISNGTITTTQPVLFWVFEQQWRLDEKGLRRWTQPPGRLPVISACGEDEARCFGRSVFVKMLGKVFRVDSRGAHECVRPDNDSPVSPEAVETYLADSEPEPIKETAPVNNPPRITKQQEKAGLTQERLDQLYYRTIGQTAEALWKTTGAVRSLIKKRKLKPVSAPREDRSGPRRFF